MKDDAVIRDWRRGMTLRERLLTIGETISPPLAMQYIIQGRGLLDPLLLQQKLEGLTSLIPALKLKLEGNKWTHHGKLLQLTVHNTSLPKDWNDDVFTTPLYSRSGMCFAFHLFQTEHSTLLFRVLHSVMDGIGALKLIEYFFRLLNNESVPGIWEHPKDHDVRQAIGRIPPAIRGGYTSKWKGLAEGTNQTGSVKFRTEVLDFNERIEGITGLVAKWYMDQTHEPARFMIPVNIRRHGIYVEALSNLSLPIYLRTTPDQSKEAIQAQLLGELARCNELAFEPTETLGRLLPNVILRKIFLRMVRKANQSGRYPMSGFISDLGKIELGNFSTSGFQATNFFSLPVYAPLTPLCLITCCHQYGTRVAFSVPDYYDITSIKRTLHQALKPAKPVENYNATPEYEDMGLLESLRITWSEILNIPAEEIRLNDRFSDLGGESINLLFLIHSVGSKYAPDKKSAFMNDVLKMSGSISIQAMMNIISMYRKKT